MEDNKTTVLIYTDGSAYPNPGLGAHGIHMVVADTATKPKNILGKFKLTPNGYKTHLAYKDGEDKTLLGMVNTIEVYGYNNDSTTNNTGELDGLIHSLKLLPDLETKVDREFKDVKFFLDSTYVINAANKILDGTMKLNEVNANKDRIKRLSKLLLVSKDTYNISLHKVKAHTGLDIGNERADMMANMGRMLRNKPDRPKEVVYIGGTDFWKDPSVDTDLYHFKQLFNFYPDAAAVDRSYYGLNYKKENEIGKKISYVSYTVMKMTEANKEISSILDTIRGCLKDRFVPYIVRLNELLGKDNLRDFMRYGDDFLVVNNRKHMSIKTITGNEIARELYPPVLSAIVSENFRGLEDELLDYVNERPTPAMTEIVDITDLVYDKDAKGNLLIKKTLKNDKPVLPYLYNGIKINMFMKYDLPPRNVLKRLEKRNPVIKLHLTDLRGVLEYKTIIALDNGDTIITNNMYSNKVLKKKKKKA